MQEQEFEKRLQEEMGGFRLRPSEDVWENVEVELRKKKKRRVLVYFFLLAGICLVGYSGYIVFHTGSRDELARQDISAPQNNLPPAATVPPAQEDEKNANDSKSIDIQQKGVGQQTPVLSIDNGKSKKEGAKQGYPAEFRTDRKDDAIARGNSIGKMIKKARQRRPPASDENVPEQKLAIQQEHEKKPAGVEGNHDMAVVRPITSAEDPGQVSGSNPIQNPGPIDSIQPAKELAGDSALLTQVEPDATIAEIKKKKDSRIRWAMDFSAGRSSSRHHALSLFSMNKSADLLYNSPILTPGGSLGSPTIMPSEVRAGAAFRVGVMGEMALSKRSSLTAGLQYMLQTNKINVGYLANTTVYVNNSFSQAARVDIVYRGIHQREYINRYHFIQVPIQFQVQLNKGSKLPVSWSAGMSAGYLVATNGLVYDTTASGIYYHDDAAFNKFQWSLNTGIAFKFGSKDKVQWSLGPELSMNMNRLMKDEFTKKQYLFYAGLTGRVYFKKRNSP